MQDGTEMLVQRLKALGDPVRLRLLALCRQGEASVGELAGVLGLSQPRVSQQLKLLCDAGLLERFRDGQRVYYRIAVGGADAGERRALVRLLPDDDPVFADDGARLLALRGEALPRDASAPGDRELHRAILDLTVAGAVGDLLDIGCGRGRLLKLLASRASRAVGVDIDATARDLARAELLLAGLGNCTLRKGDMYQLPFVDGEFDTVILDDVLGAATRPVAVLEEAGRVLRPGGRLFVLERTDQADATAVSRHLAECCAGAGLRLAPGRRVPGWLLAVARLPEKRSAAA